MLFYTCINDSPIIGFDQLQLAKRKASDLKAKYPNKRITVRWSTGIIEINTNNK